MRDAIRGLWIGLLVFAVWVVSLVGLLALPLRPANWAVIPLGSAWMTFLYTGLFITAHDAIHGSVWPHHRAVNRWIARVILMIYALFPYKTIRDAHFQHHRTPGRPEDPDYHGEQHAGFLRWYLHFMSHYLTVLQVVGMALIFNLLQYVAGVSLWNLLAFWVGPALLSTLQLFTFGTYLPHRTPPGGYTNRHHARSSPYPRWLSFLTCYHFGYHLEHHRFPNVPWWRLPEVRARSSQP